MTEDIESADERLFARIILGEVERDSTEARELLDRSPAYRTQLAELEHVQKVLDAEGEEERATLEALEGEPGDEARSTEASDRMRAIIETSAHPEASGATSDRAAPRARWPWLLLAAAALALVATLPTILDGTGRGDGGERTLGPGGIDEMAPAGPVTDFREFSWQHELPSGGSFEVRVWSAESTGGALLLEKTRLKEPRWILDGTELPEVAEVEEIRWELRVLDFAGGEVASGEQRAWRSR